jgi:hypothetical protein
MTRGGGGGGWTEIDAQTAPVWRDLPSLLVTTSAPKGMFLKQLAGRESTPNHCAVSHPHLEPGAPVTKQWASWDDMALDAGMSRLLGGIHAMSAHQGSVGVADALHDLLDTAWGLRVAEQ